MLLYNYKEVESYLNEKSISQFMKAHGYNTLKIEDILDKISKRFKSFKDSKNYKDNNVEFPHELGIERAKETVMKKAMKGISFYPITLPNTLSPASFGISIGE